MGRSSVTTGLLHKPDGLKAYFAGTTSYSTGAAFCYVENETVETTRGEPTAAEQTDSLGREIEKPTAENLATFAGWAKQGGTGPGIVELYAPERGCILDVQVDGGTVNVAVNSILMPSNGTHYLVAVADPTNTALMVDAYRQGVAIAMEAETDDAANQSSGQLRRVRVL
jgi:hypothetical protein